MSQDRWRWRILMAWAILGLARVALGFVHVSYPDGKPRHWDLIAPVATLHTNILNPKTRAIRYYLASDGASTTNTSNELNAIRAAFAQWASIPGTHLRFEDAGTVAPGVDIDLDDNTNVVFWASPGAFVNGGRDDIRGALALTYLKDVGDGHLEQGDIVLNGGYPWFADPGAKPSASHFIEAVVLHEIGHFIGLAHSPVGSSTMLARGGSGVSPLAGLSQDEVAAARFIYPPPSTSQDGLSRSLGSISGLVTMAGKPVLGATVFAEDADGNLVQGTVTGAEGRYSFPALVPGKYRLRVCPFDPTGVRSSLLTGLSINELGTFRSAETQFAPLPDLEREVLPGETLTQHFEVQSESSPWRITRIAMPEEIPANLDLINAAVSVRAGQRRIYVGVAGPNLPTSDATLTLTGAGFTAGPLEVDATGFTGLTLLYFRIDVAEDAIPGMRTFVLKSGQQIAYANGFLDLQPRFPDWNFDGVDDLFQRRHFGLFTRSEAGPEQDPDRDGLTNLQESLIGTDPWDARSAFLIDSITRATRGVTLRWRGAAGHRYRVLSRDDLANSAWRVAGEVIAGSSEWVEFTDKAATDDVKFYRVMAIP